MTPDKILQTGLAFWPSKTLLSAIELGLFTELAARPAGTRGASRRDCGFIRARRAISSIRWWRWVSLRAAATATPTRRRPTSSSTGQKPSYVGGILEMANHRLYPFWGHLTEALRTGQPQNEVKAGGPALFETLYADPARLKEFLAAMTGISHGANMTIARAFPWKDYAHVRRRRHGAGRSGRRRSRWRTRTCAASGSTCRRWRRFSSEYVAAVGVADRVSFTPGSFFERDLPKADVVMMGHILHDWDLPTKRMLIEKAFDALPAGGALIVYEAIIDDDRSKNAFGLMMSLNMLIETPGGFDYTGRRLPPAG